MTRKEIGDAVGSIIVGAMLGMLVVVTTLGSIGALDETPGVNPFGDGPIFGTSPDATPTPEPTPTAGQIFKERKKWDSRRKLNPGNGQNQREKTIETSKRKMRDKIATDDDRDGIVEATVVMYIREDPVFGSLVYGTMTHRCCSCALTHSVEFRLVLSSLGTPLLHQRWEIDDKATHRNRIEQFGPSYWKPENPFDEERRWFDDDIRR
jgi:hypothetical protein